MDKKKHIIWDSHWKYDDRAYKEWAKETLEFMLDEDRDDFENLSKSAYHDYINNCLEDERANLNTRVNGFLVAFGELGLWDGKVIGIKTFHDNFINEILYSDCENACWYSDDYNIYGEMHHHDGRNLYLYRIAKSMEDVWLMKNLASRGELTREKFCRKTESLYPQVANIFGWEIKNRHQKLQCVNHYEKA